MKLYDDGLVRLYCGDARAVIPTLGVTVGMVLTDPPYGIGYSTGRRKGVQRSTTRHAGDRMVAPLLGDIGDSVAPLLGDGAVGYWFAAPKMLNVVLPVLMGRWEVPNILVWDKGNCAAGDLACTYGQQWEAVIYTRRRRVPLIGGRDRDILRFGRGDTSAYRHPTQKPTALLGYLIGRHVIDGVVLDPFVGGGSTLLAARDLGIPAIGIEIDPRHAESALAALES